jgi:hypothetical protein
MLKRVAASAEGPKRDEARNQRRKPQANAGRRALADHFAKLRQAGSVAPNQAQSVEAHVCLQVRNPPEHFRKRFSRLEH